MGWRNGSEVKALAPRAWGPKFRSPQPHKKLGMAVYIHDSATFGEQGKGWASWLPTNCRFSERPCLKRIQSKTPNSCSGMQHTHAVILCLYRTGFLLSLPSSIKASKSFPFSTHRGWELLPTVLPYHILQPYLFSPETWGLKNSICIESSSVYNIPHPPKLVCFPPATGHTHARHTAFIMGITWFYLSVLMQARRCFRASDLFNKPGGWIF